MNANSIKKDLINLLNEKFDIQTNQALEYSDTSLFITPFNLKVEDVILLVALIMEKFVISFSEEDFTNYKFSSIDRISNIIFMRLKNR